MATPFLDKVMEDERRGLLAEQVYGDCPPYAAVTDMATVRDTPRAVRDRHPVTLQSHIRGAFVQTCPTLGTRFLWAHVNDDDYRDTYASYLAQFLNGGAAVTLPPTLNVDHLYNRERVRIFGLTYIRLALIPEGPNKSHGAGYEKARGGGVGREGRPRSVDTVMMMKLFGFSSPSIAGRPSPQVAAFARMMAPRLGVSPAALEAEIADLVDVARFRPA
jgi:hypothetical protein